VEPRGGVSTLVENVACLGCGCTCDDIAIRVDGEAIIETQNVCALGDTWFRAPRSTSLATVDGRDATVEQAVATAIRLLGSATRPLVLVVPGLSCEEQRVCVAIADVLRARLDSTTTSTSLPQLIASQERGFAAATFGEVRNRADLVIYWGVDIAGRYPRFVSRYAPTSGKSVAVDVGAATATVDSNARFGIDPASELSTLIALRNPASDGIGALFNGKQYVALVYDAEPDERAVRSPQRFDAIIALAQSLNAQTRCAALGLRGAGNSPGADSVFTAHTGYPIAIDFARGYPRYRPYTATEADVVLVVGDGSASPHRHVAGVPTIAIGPNATRSALGWAVSIDAGAAGTHTSGTAVRADDVPLPLRPALHAPRSVSDVLQTLLAAVR
jgi:formylmethanofuran dehydrogenase subunit B